MMIFQIVAFLAGVIIVLAILFSAIRTFVLPRGVLDWLTRTIFIIVQKVFSVLLLRADTFQKKDNLMAFFAPISLMSLLPTWFSLVILGYTAIFWGLGGKNWYQAFKLAGSSVLTLGFASSDRLIENFLILSASMIGLILVALLISYLPTIYNAFARRENLVNKLEVRAGSPPSALEMLLRFHRIHGLERLTEQWVAWETWFSEIEESHTSLPALVFFRSPRSNHSWITASGAVLDAAAITLSAVNISYDPSAALCIRAGYLALRDIADEFGIAYNPAPHFPEDPIVVSQDEFFEVIDKLRAVGIPIKSDLDQVWRDFAGWRVNYEPALIQLAQITMAPESPWTGERLDWRIISPTIFKLRKSK